MTLHSRRWLWVELFLPRPLAFTTVTELLTRLATAHRLGPIILETRYEAAKLRHFIGAPPRTLDAVLGVITPLLPGLAVSRDSSARTPVTLAARVTLTAPQLALTTDRQAAVTRAVVASLMSPKHPQTVVVMQCVIGHGTSPRKVNGSPADPHQSLLSVLWDGVRPADRATATAIQHKAGEHRLATDLRIGVHTVRRDRSRNLLTSLFNALRVAETVGTRMTLAPISPGAVNDVELPCRFRNVLSASELSSLLGWPVGDGPFPTLPSVHPRQLPPPSLERTERIFATATAPGAVGTPVGIPIDAARRHTLFLGPTGSGKSTAMLHLIEADMRAGRSVLVMDPKNDLARDVLARVPAHRRADVVVIDPSQSAPVGINPLAHGARDPNVLADSLLAVFKQVYATSWGVRTEDVLSASLLSLARTNGASLLWLPALLTNPTLRQQLLPHGHDPLGVDQFWAGYDQLGPTAQGTMIGPVLNKLRQFLLRPALRAVLGQTAPRFYLAELFTGRKIVIVPLNKGILGAEVARLLGSLIIGSLWPLVLARASLPESRRHTVSLYLDEFANFLHLPGDLSEALAQSRSMGVAWHLATQYLDQLTPAMRSAVEANVVNRIVFGLNATDAHTMAKQAPGLDSQDFLLLPRYQTYTTIAADHGASQWFSATTLAPSQPVSDPLEIQMASQLQYGVPAQHTKQAVLAQLGYPITPNQPRPPGRQETTPAPASTPTTSPVSTTPAGPIGRKKRT